MPTTPPAPGSPRRLAVGYLRRSTDRQEHSIADQQAALERFASEPGVTVARYYTDDALSGTSSARPAFQEMIADACESAPGRSGSCWCTASSGSIR